MSLGETGSQRLCYADSHSCSLQLSRFLWDHGDIAFAPLGRLMLENFRLEGNRVRSRHHRVDGQPPPW